MSKCLRILNITLSEKVPSGSLFDLHFHFQKVLTVNGVSISYFLRYGSLNLVVGANESTIRKNLNF